MDHPSPIRIGESPEGAAAARAAAPPRGLPRRPRPVAGTWLHPGPQGDWRRLGPGLELLEATGPSDVIAAVADWLVEARRDPCTGAPAAKGIHTAAAALGVLEPATVAPSPVARVVLDASGPLGDPIASLLEAEGIPVQHAHASQATEPHDIVVVAHPVLRDSACVALDAELAVRGVPWHRCAREGGHWSVGPLSIGGGSASYRDLRVRRLAAAEAPDELEARWSFLDALPPDVADAPGPAEAALVAARLVLDVLALRDGRTAAGVDAELVLDPATGATVRHPVLAVPRGPSM